MKNKKYKIPCYVDVELTSVIEDLKDLFQRDPKDGAKTIREFGINGDWSLEYEYFKLMKKDLKSDFGKKAADHMQAILDIMDNDENN